jgi:arsenate reductase-like glutaredoxin family protein
MAQLVNVKSQTFKKLKPNLTQMLDKDIAQLIQDNPLIMVRPILTDDEQVVMGFKEDEYHKFTA